MLQDLSNNFVDRKFLSDAITPIQESLEKISTSMRASAESSQIPESTPPQKGTLTPPNNKVTDFYIRAAKETPFMTDVSRYGAPLSRDAIQAHHAKKQAERVASILSQPMRTPNPTSRSSPTRNPNPSPTATRVHIIPHSHTDLGWLHPIPHYYTACSLDHPNPSRAANPINANQSNLGHPVAAPSVRDARRRVPATLVVGRLKCAKTGVSGGCQVGARRGAQLRR